MSSALSSIMVMTKKTLNYNSFKDGITQVSEEMCLWFCASDKVSKAGWGGRICESLKRATDSEQQLLTSRAGSECTAGCLGSVREADTQEGIITEATDTDFWRPTVFFLHPQKQLCVSRIRVCKGFACLSICLWKYKIGHQTTKTN